MKSVAFISAAGWKRSGEDHGLADCPEPFLPLGDGTTPLYRIARILSGLGFEIYIAMAPVGYKFHQHWPKFTEGRPPLEGSPWTQERVDYASQLGTVIHVPNPGRSGSNDTFCKMLEAVTDWDRVLMARGDILTADRDLEIVIETLPWPSQYQMACNHSYYLLDQKSAAIYLQQMAPWRCDNWLSRTAWSNAMHRWVPDGHPEGTGQFADAGIPSYGGHNGPKLRWKDIDNARRYDNVLKLVADGTFAWEDCRDE